MAYLQQRTFAGYRCHQDEQEQDEELFQPFTGALDSAVELSVLVSQAHVGVPLLRTRTLW